MNMFIEVYDEDEEVRKLINIMHIIRIIDDADEVLIETEEDEITVKMTFEEIKKLIKGEKDD